MHYAVPDKLREETDPITEWIIKKNDRKLIKYAIKQKYIGKKNADALLKYYSFFWQGGHRSENYRFTGGTKECAVIK